LGIECCHLPEALELSEDLIISAHSTNAGRDWLTSSPERCRAELLREVAELKRGIPDEIARLTARGDATP